MNFLAEYVEIVVLGICMCVGYVMKHSINAFPNKYIPLVMAILGVILNVWVNQGTFNPEVLLGGLLSGLAATGVHQTVKYFRKGEDEEW